MSFVKKHKWILLVVPGVLLALILGAVIYVSSLFNSIQPIEDIKKEDMVNPNISDEVKETMEGYWTIALFGVDSREGDLGKGTLADVQIICNIDRKTGEIRLVSVYRDTYLKVSDKGKYSKINDAYLFGGPSQALYALSENLDLSFDDCVAFNWKAVADAINLLGGIDIEITKDEFRLINGYITETVESTGIYSTHLKKAGMNHLDGVQAVSYARLRKTDTDFKRTERQRTVIAKALEKAKNADFSVLNNILVTVLPQIKSTITIDDLIPMAKNITRYHIGESEGFPFDKAVKMVGDKDCVVPTTLESNVSKLHGFLFDDYNYKPSKNVKEISDRISGDSSGSKKQESKKQETKKKADVITTTEEINVDETQEGGMAESESASVPETKVTGPGSRPAPGRETTGEYVRPIGPGEKPQAGPGETTAGNPAETLPETSPQPEITPETGTEIKTETKPETQPESTVSPPGPGVLRTGPEETKTPETRESRPETVAGPGVESSAVE